MKLLLCARDVMMGIVLPWHISDVQKTLITNCRNRLEAVIGTPMTDASIASLLDDAVAVATTVAQSSRDVRNIYDKMDRARLTLTCLRARL